MRILADKNKREVHKKVIIGLFRYNLTSYITRGSRQTIV